MLSLQARSRGNAIPSDPPYCVLLRAVIAGSTTVSCVDDADTDAIRQEAEVDDPG